MESPESKTSDIFSGYEPMQLDIFTDYLWFSQPTLSLIQGDCMPPALYGLSYRLS